MHDRNMMHLCMQLNTTIVPRYLHTCASSDSSLYIFGGIGSAGQTLDDLVRYNVRPKPMQHSAVVDACLYAPVNRWSVCV